MINTILGLKVGNSQTFVDGFKIPVTKVVAGPCVVTQIKTQDKDGYWALQIGFSSKKAKNTSKPLQGHLKKIKTQDKTEVDFPRYLREVKLKSEPQVKIGDTLSLTQVLRVGDIVAVSGVSKGKGFAGVVKRHGFRGGPRTHGQSDRERAPGSVGQTTTPGRVYRGKRMAGRMGSEMVTIKNLHIVSINPDANEIEVSGQLPGRPGSLLIIKKIKSGSLKDMAHDVVAQVVEGEAQAEVKEPQVNPEGGSQNA